MSPKKRFIKSAFILFFIIVAAFLLEFYLEWKLHGEPGLHDLSWADVNNAKLVDLLSPVARAYNNIVAMFLAAIAIAIPITANTYTPKLIEMFLHDRINQFMLLFWVIGAANTLWVIYIIGPDFAPVWAVGIAVIGAMVGWIMLIPFFFYVMRFLDPKNIITRLAKDVLDEIDVAGSAKNKQHIDHIQDMVCARIDDISAILVKLIDRGDRTTVPVCLNTFLDILHHYASIKPHLGKEWFEPPHKYFINLSKEVRNLLAYNRTWVEYWIQMQLFIAYQAALIQCQDLISLIGKMNRLIALNAVNHRDRESVKLSIRFFNNDMRESIKEKKIHALYDLCWQYRELAKSLLGEEDIIKNIFQYYIYYYNLAQHNHVAFGGQIILYDLYAIVREAFEQNSPIKMTLLDIYLNIPDSPEQEIFLFQTKIKVILGGFFVKKHLNDEAATVRGSLRHVDLSTLRLVEKECLDLQEPSFWEATDREIVFEWVPFEDRPALSEFINSFD